MSALRRYPLASIGEWYGHCDYLSTGGELSQMSPDHYLSLTRPLTLDNESRDTIEALIRHIEAGGQLDPLAIYPGGKEDGRHRAYAARELGIKSVTVLTWPDGFKAY